MPTFRDKQPASNADDATLPAGSSAVPPDQAPPDLMVFKCRKRLRQDSARPAPRYSRRLADQITASFYEACRIGNLHAARQLAEALECEVARSARLAGTDLRENGDGLAAVRARYELEVAQQQRDQEQATSSVA